MQSNNAGVQQAEDDTKKSGYETKNLYTLQVDDKGKPELVTTDTSTLDTTTHNTLAHRINQTPDKSGYDRYLLGHVLATKG